jgi:hypothetical protein
MTSAQVLKRPTNARRGWMCMRVTDGKWLGHAYPSGKSPAKSRHLF